MEVSKEISDKYISRLKQIRISRKFTQKQLEELSGVSIKSIAAYEQTPKKINKASLETVVKLANILDCSLEDLYENDEDKK